MSSSIITSCLQTCATAASGVIAGKTCIWLSKKVEKKTGSNLGSFLNKIPFSVQDRLIDCASLLKMPLGWLYGKTAEFVGDEVFSDAIAPVLEEAIFRLGLQGGISYALLSMGFNPTVADAVSISSASLLFGMCHDSYLPSSQFNQTMIVGTVFGVLQSYAGYPTAVIAHSMYNTSMDLQGVAASFFSKKTK